MPEKLAVLYIRVEPKLLARFKAYCKKEGRHQAVCFGQVMDIVDREIKKSEGR